MADVPHRVLAHPRHTPIQLPETLIFSSLLSAIASPQHWSIQMLVFCLPIIFWQFWCSKYTPTASCLYFYAPTKLSVSCGGVGMKMVEP